MVLPSAMAASKLPLIPMDRIGLSILCNFLCQMSRANLAVSEKYFLYSSKSDVAGAIVINPQSSMCGYFASLRQKSESSSGSRPLFDYSRPILISTRTRVFIPIFADCFSISSASPSDSSEWISVTLSMIDFTLFLCRCPMKCISMRFFMPS